MIFVFAIFSFIWPFGSFYYALRNFGKKRYRFLILLFFVIGGLLIIPYEHGDIMKYLIDFEVFKNFSFQDYLREILNSFTGQGINGFEIYLTTNLFIVSRFTDNIAFTFALTAIIYYLFWIKITGTLYDEYLNSNRNIIAKLLLIAFAIYIIFYRAINGRFYLAYWGFVLAAYQIIFNKDRRYIFLALLTIFIHQAYFFINAVLLLFLFTGKLHKYKQFELVLFALIVIGTIYSETGLSLVTKNLEIMGTAVEDKFSPYTSIDYIESVSERNRAWFLVIRGNLLFYATAINVLIARYSKKLVFSKNLTKLYYFFLLLWAANAFTYNIPSMGERFRNVLIGFGLLILFHSYVRSNIRKIPVYMWAFFGAFAFYKLVTLRIMAEYINLWLFAPLSIIVNILGGPFSLYELIY